MPALAIHCIESVHNDIHCATTSASSKMCIEFQQYHRADILCSGVTNLNCVQHVAEALRRQPQDVLDARMQRHKRAMDLSLKHTNLPKDMQEIQTPFSYYLQDSLTRVQAEESERFDAGAGRSKEREIP